MITYCIYKNPSDYPDKFVVRRWDGLTPETLPLMVSDTLDEARIVIPVGLTKIGRHDTEDISILESYI